MEMKKKKFIKFLKIGTLFIGVSIMLWNCSQKEDQFLINSQRLNNIEKISFDELPSNLSYNISLIKGTRKVKTKNSKGNLIIDQTQILKLVDSLKNTKYAIKFSRAGQPDNILYNLILGSDRYNQEISPFVMKYIVENKEESLINGEIDFSKIKGKILVYSFNEFLNSFNHSNKNKTSKRKEPIECKSLVTNSSNHLGGNTGDNSGGSGGGGGSYEDYDDIPPAILDQFSQTTCNIITWSDAVTGEISGISYSCDNGDQGYIDFKNGQPIYSKNSINRCDDIGEIPINEGDDDKHIDDLELTGKAKCLNDYLTQKGNNYVKDLLANFKGNSEFDLNISSKDKIYSKNRKSYVHGQTSYKNGDKIIYISISEDKIENSSVLVGINTILHEYIHADIFRKLNTKYDSQDGIKDFKTTYEKYKLEGHHNSMASLYINSMTKFLKEIHKNILSREYNYLSNNGTKSLDDMYEALAWQGLKNHKLEAWKELGQDTIRINTALTTYYHSLTKTCPN